MLSHTALAIANSLTKIFRLSLKQQKVPSPWKVSYVNPIPKGKDIQLCSNYRPISLLSLPSKILERLIHSHITKFLTKNKLLSNIQFGFRPHSSTQEALLSITNSWHSLLTKHRQVAAVSLDVKKAFDCASLSSHQGTPFHWNSRASSQLVQGLPHLEISACHD